MRTHDFFFSFHIGGIHFYLQPLEMVQGRRRNRKVFGKKQGWDLKTENLDLDSRSAFSRDRLSVQVGP